MGEQALELRLEHTDVAAAPRVMAEPSTVTPPPPGTSTVTPYPLPPPPPPPKLDVHRL